MVDLYKEIEFKDFIEKHKEEYPDIDKYIQEFCVEEQQTPDFKNQEWRRPIQNTSFSNFVLIMGIPIVPQEKIGMLKN